MGIDASMAIRFKSEPTEKQLGQLAFHLRHRFGSILNDPIIRKVDHDLGAWDEVSADDGLLYRVNVMSRYYGEDYERGPGLELGALLIFLCRHQDIQNVYYGGDEYLPEHTEEKAIELLNHWIENGNLPYLYSSTTSLSKNRPTCPNCFMDMIPGATNRDSVRWFCGGCGYKISTLRKG